MLSPSELSLLRGFGKIGSITDRGGPRDEQPALSATDLHGLRHQKRNTAFPRAAHGHTYFASVEQMAFISFQGLRSAMLQSWPQVMPFDQVRVGKILSSAK